MPRVDYTRKIIADSFIELMQTINYDNITVSDITKKADISRHTFYYHFEDKYALLAWLFRQQCKKEFPLPTKEDIVEGRVFYIRTIIDHMFRNRIFYINIFHSSADRTVSDLLFEHIFEFRKIQIEGLLGNRKIKEDGKIFMCRYFTCSITGMIRLWALDGMKDPITVFFTEYFDIARQSLEYFIDKYSED